jgi:1-acyl-sn-glycerol-3-phosphate acyltransferase
MKWVWNIGGMILRDREKPKYWKRNFNSLHRAKPVQKLTVSQLTQKFLTLIRKPEGSLSCS